MPVSDQILFQSVRTQEPSVKVDPHVNKNAIAHLGEKWSAEVRQVPLKPTAPEDPGSIEKTESPTFSNIPINGD